MTRDYCERHDVQIDELPADYDWCPYCREEDRQARAEMERAVRDRRVEPF